MDFSWYSHQPIDIQQQLLVLGAVLLALGCSILYIGASAFIKRLDARAANIREFRLPRQLPRPPREPRLKPSRPNLFESIQRNKVVSPFIEFFNWYFKLLGI